MTPILYEKDEIDFTSQGLGSLVEIYDVDVAEQRNGLLQLTASYPVTDVRYDDISVGRIILAKPNQRDEPHAFRITSTDLDIMGHNVMIEADSITYDLNHNIVKHLNVSDADGQTMMSALKNAIVNPSIFNFYSDINHMSGTSLDYVNPMEAVMGVKGSFLQIWGGELKRENRRITMFNRRGRDNVATFRLGKNISGLKYKVDISSLVTRILPIKSIQENDTTTYLEGTPVSSQYINSYEQIYTIKVDFTDDTIKTVDDLNKASANWFVDSANTARDKPSVTIDIDVLSLQDSADYQDKFKDLESVALTDTVTVYVPEYGINVTAIVNELHFDPIQERVTKLTVGTAKQSFADSSRTQLSDLQDKIISVQNQADAAAVSANGKNTNYYGSIEPSHPQAGDLWYWKNGDLSGIKQFVNGDWADVVDTNTQQQITDGINKAVTQANAHTDEVKQSLVSDIETAKSQAASQASTAEANAKSEATSLFSRAQNALSDAKTELTKSIASEASARNQAVSDLDTKAQGYADTAKADAISAATTADGFINKKIDDTASSITSTISQNKTDADGKIATAQSTATQALNGLATKVSQTVYDAKTGQLQADLNTTTTTANTAKTDIVAIKSDNTKQDARMTTIESDADGTKTTVSNLKKDLGKANGSISTLQQRADGFDATVTKISTSVNSLNQINNVINSEFSPDLAGWYVRGDTSHASVIDSGSYGYNTSGYVVIDSTGKTGGDFFFTSAPYPVNAGGVPFNETLRIRTNVSNATVGIGVVYYDVNKSIIGAYRTTVSATGDWSLFSYSGTLPNTAYYISFDVMIPSSTLARFVISQPMIVISTSIGDYVAGSYNNNDALAKVKLTADKATFDLSTYKTDADGRISKAQADITATAKQVATKVSQTDYDTKTGQLTTSVSKAQQTADAVTTSLGNYKQDADGRISANSADIITNANAIKQKVAQSDYDANNTKLTSRLTTVETTASGTATTVSNLQQTVNALGQVNQLFNTEFSPDFSGWFIRGYYNQDISKGGWVKGYPVNGHGSISHVKQPYLGNLQSPLVNANGASKISISAVVSVYSDDGVGNSYITLDAFNQDGTFVSQITAVFIQNGAIDKYIKLENITIPSNVSYVSLGMLSPSATVTYKLSQPMLAFASTVGTYVQGNYNNNAALAQVKITADGISNFVRDSSGNISSDFQTALSKTSLITGSTLASSIQKQTSSQITSALTDNNGKIISLINQDTSGVQIAGKNIVLNGDTTVTGAFKVSQANIANGAIGTAQIGDVAITSAKIANLDVSKITGNVTNFIQSNWNGVYESTTITNDGMQIVTSDITTNFGPRGIKLTQGGESVGGIGVSSYVGMPTNFQGIAFNLDGTGDYMTWSARDSGVTTGDYTTKLAWFRSSYKPIGQNAGFNFSSDSPVTFWGDIYGRENTEPLKIANFGMKGVSAGGIGHGNGSSAITFGGDGETYVISSGTYYKLAQLVKALQPLIGLGTWSAPKNINSSGVVTQWTNVTT